MAQGVQFGRVVQEICAVVADPVRGGLLQTEVGGPMLRMVRLMHDMDERPVLHPDRLHGGRASAAASW